MRQDYVDAIVDLGSLHRSRVFRAAARPGARGRSARGAGSGARQEDPRAGRGEPVEVSASGAAASVAPAPLPWAPRTSAAPAAHPDRRAAPEST